MIGDYPMDIRFDHVALFLDLDGTLAHFEALPGDVGPENTRNALLRDLAVRLDGRMAIISGRSVSEVDRILEGAVISVAGSHGLERRDARLDRVTTPPHRNLVLAVSEVAKFAERFPGVVVERKPLSVAFHYRTNPSVEAAALVFADELARTSGLKLQRGDKVVELMSPGMDKGRAIRAFMVEPPFAGALPIFVGDDFTDEDGFRVVASLGGIGILVGPPRQTFAQYRLAGVDEVQAWLERALKEQHFSMEACIEPSHRRI